MNTDAKFRLLACQIDIPAMTSITQRDAHLQSSASKVRRALERSPADLVVLPELSSIDYARETFDHLDELAEALDGPSFQCWRKVAEEFATCVVYSFPRRDENGVYICIAAVDPGGALIGHYDKIHLAQYGASMEKEFFQRGDHLLIFKVHGFKIAPIICYDIRIPELSRTLTVDHDVDLILHCGAYYRDESFHTWHAFATTRALENQVFYLSLNRAGEHYGNSLFCWPWMDEEKPSIDFDRNREQFLSIDIDRETIDTARRQYSFLHDRLPTYNMPVIEK